MRKRPYILRPKPTGHPHSAGVLSKCTRGDQRVPPGQLNDSVSSTTLGGWIGRMRNLHPNLLGDQLTDRLSDCHRQFAKMRRN